MTRNLTEKEERDELMQKLHPGKYWRQKFDAMLLTRGPFFLKVGSQAEVSRQIAERLYCVMPVERLPMVNDPLFDKLKLFKGVNAEGERKAIQECEDQRMREFAQCLNSSRLDCFDYIPKVMIPMYLNRDHSKGVDLFSRL